MEQQDSHSWRRTSLELPQVRIEQLEQLRRQWGLRHRGAVVERLLQQLFAADGEPDLFSEPLEELQPPPSPPAALNESLALVLRDAGNGQPLDPEPEAEVAAPDRARRGGIDLPGFVQRRSGEIRRDPHTAAAAAPMPAPPLSAAALAEALEQAREHWIDLYGTPANPTVLEYAMVWLAKDIWPQSDQSEGRPFTWPRACRLIGEPAASWSDSPPSFERVMVVAGILEDPFSASTLPLRLPTLIRRFVQRFRRRSRGTSFQTLEHTMTLQGALKLLQLSSPSGTRLSLAQIREAYRQMALDHHPDAGGSPESMRRLNEAYQLLKELYRDPAPDSPG